MVGQTILIIDDEEELCILLTYALSQLGYNIEYALSLEDGSEKLKKYSPDIVLLDINLPDGSGLDMIPRLKQQRAAFMIISAYDDKKEQALREGAFAFIKKPFNMQTITQSIVDNCVN